MRWLFLSRGGSRATGNTVVVQEIANRSSPSAIDRTEIMQFQEGTSRRTVLKTIGVGAVGVALTGAASASDDEFARELGDVRSGTRAYRDIENARDAGYVPVLGYISGMGFHFVKEELLAADVTERVDVTRPPILVYFTTGNYSPSPGDSHDPDRDDDLRLGGVEYAHLGDDGGPGAPANYFSDEEAGRDLKVSEEHGWHWTDPPGVTALHVWVHRRNPRGVFNPINPTID